MSYSRASFYLHSETGRRIVSYVAGGVVCGIGCAYLLPHWVLIDKYKSVLQLYTEGFPQKLSSDLEKLAKEELEKNPFVSARNKKYVQFFHIFGFDAHTIGSVELNCGARVGIPINFGYNDKNDIDKSRVQVGLKPVNWESSAGKKLLDSLVLTDDAKRFAINCQLYHATRYRQFEVVLPVTLSLVVYLGSSNINNNLRLFEKSFAYRFVMYAAVFSFVLITWIGINDILKVECERGADEDVSKFGRNYVEGGIRYYQQLIDRNIALREILGPNNGSKFTSKGNYDYWIRTPTVPLVQRLEEMKKRLKDSDHSVTA